jgi:hypothetical protein
MVFALPIANASILAGRTADKNSTRAVGIFRHCKFSLQVLCDETTRPIDE